MSVKTIAISNYYCCQGNSYTQWIIPKEHLSKSTRKFLKKYFNKRDLYDDKMVWKVIKEASRGINSVECTKEIYLESDYQFWSQVC